MLVIFDSRNFFSIFPNYQKNNINKYGLNVNMSKKDEILEFYKHYPIDHWIYKARMLKNLIENFDSVKEILLKDLIDVVDKDCINMLKAEIHFTYFQIIEALFELIFALENRKDKLLWFYISFSPYKKNFRRIGKVASGITDFLFKDVELPFGKVIPLIQYIFYFGAFFPISDTDMKNNLEMIKRILILFAKDFSDRNEYNAYKHSLRFYHSPIWLEFGEILNGDKTKPILNMNTEDSFTFLCKNQDGNIDSRTKAFERNRDYKMIALCHNLIQNVINLRKRSFFAPNEKAKACMFNKLDLTSINKRKDTFIDLKSTIFWRIDK